MARHPADKAEKKEGVAHITAPVDSSIEYLRARAASLPLCPGVYIMKDALGSVIYVGKSRKLKNRVSSYFIGEHSGKTARMVSLVRDFDYIVCKTEIEALTLENVLIKRHTPKYNIKLKDCKSYPYIKITAGEYPRIIVSRERRDDGARYFGPYRGISDAYSAANTVMKIFRLPSCKRSFPRDIGRERPCIYAQIGRCCALCAGAVGADEYRESIKGAAAVLNGSIGGAVEQLSASMRRYAEQERFEEAAKCRDSIASLKLLCEKQTVVGDTDVDADVFAIYSDDLCSVLSVLSVRSGALISKNEFLFSASEILDPPAALSFICSYYSEKDAVPREVLLAFNAEADDASGAEEYLSDKAGRHVSVRTPKRGAYHRLAQLAHSNAQQRASLYAEENKREDRAIVRLAALAALEVVPSRIEAYDISNIGSEHITASMVVWKDGRMKKSDYRSFNIKTTDGVNDYGAMYEALTRRFAHIGDGSESLGDAPDLILLDGGNEHVAVGIRAMQDAGVSIPLLGMVKDDYHKTRALTDGEREIHIATEQQVYVLIYRIQEEAHRFAVSHTMGAKRKTLRHSSLEEINGIGPAKAKILISHFGSIKKLRDAKREDIAKVAGISMRDAVSITEYFGGKTK